MVCVFRFSSSTSNQVREKHIRSSILGQVYIARKLQKDEHGGGFSSIHRLEIQQTRLHLFLKQRSKQQIEIENVKQHLSMGLGTWSDIH